MYQIVVVVHVLAAMVWVGGMLFLALVVAPATRSIPADRRAELFDAVGRRFRVVGWASLAVLVVTGALNLWYRSWMLTPVLEAKLVAVAAMIGVTAYHDLTGSRLAARLAGLLGVVVVALAVFVVRGLPV